MNVIELYKHHYSKKEARGFIEAPTLNYYPTTNKIAPKDMQDTSVYYTESGLSPKQQPGKGFFGDVARAMEDLENTRKKVVSGIESLKHTIQRPIPMDGDPDPDPRYNPPKYVPPTIEEHNKEFWEEWNRRYANTPRGYFNRCADGLVDGIKDIFSRRNNIIPPRLFIPRRPIK